MNTGLTNHINNYEDFGPSVRVFVGMSSTLLAFLRGELSPRDLESGVLIVHCQKQHLFPEWEYAPKEAAWATKEDQEAEVVDKHLVRRSDLTPETRASYDSWANIISGMRRDGRVAYQA